MRFGGNQPVSVHSPFIALPWTPPLDLGREEKVRIWIPARGSLLVVKQLARSIWPMLALDAPWGGFSGVDQANHEPGGLGAS